MAKPPFWENSAKDKALDKKGAKKAGVSMKKWEGSKADEKMDKAGSKGKGKPAFLFGKKK